MAQLELWSKTGRRRCLEGTLGQRLCQIGRRQLEGTCSNGRVLAEVSSDGPARRYGGGLLGPFRLPPSALVLLCILRHPCVRQNHQRQSLTYGQHTRLDLCCDEQARHHERICDRISGMCGAAHRCGAFGDASGRASGGSGTGTFRTRTAFLGCG